MRMPLIRLKMRGARHRDYVMLQKMRMQRIGMNSSRRLETRGIGFGKKGVNLKTYILDLLKRQEYRK
jgi:hypothetical protein